jgi:hypothetical protein
VTLGILDNELQHHKFFQEFLSLGLTRNSSATSSGVGNRDTT